MSGVEILNLENIYLFDGGTKENWDFFNKDINNESYCKKIMFTIFNYLTSQPKNEITLDVIDYILDFGCPHIKALCATKELLDQILNLLKPETDAGLENQKKAIFLIQKWAKKFANEENMKIFDEQYNMLKNSGVTFPGDDFVIDTYNKFIGDKQSTNNTQTNQNENSQSNQNENHQSNKNENPEENNMSEPPQPQPQPQAQEEKKEEINNEPEQQEGFPPVENEQGNVFENNEQNQPKQQNDNDINLDENPFENDAQKAHNENESEKNIINNNENNPESGNENGQNLTRAPRPSEWRRSRSARCRAARRAPR